MMEKYKTDVRRSYEKKKAAGELSLNLLHPTPANLRNECTIRLKGRFGCGKAELRTLKSFFEQPHNENLSELTVKRFDPDKFKPLINFLRGKTMDTADKNIELLAWLIDFPQRPYSAYRNTESTVNLFLPPLSSHRFGLKRRKGRLKKKLLMVANYRHSRLMQKELLADAGIAFPHPNHWPFRSKDAKGHSELFSTEKAKPPKKVTLEYPSGVRLSVDASDLLLIAQLLRL